MKKEEKELNQKIKDLESKIKQIKELGGNPQTRLINDLSKLKEELKIVQNQPDPVSDALKQLRQDFDREYHNHIGKINQLATLAKKNLDAAIALSEQTGIPFCSDVTEMSDCYVPDSFDEMWNKVDGLNEDQQEEIQDDLDSFFEKYDFRKGGFSGWQQSQRC